MFAGAIPKWLALGWEVKKLIRLGPRVQNMSPQLREGNIFE